MPQQAADERSQRDEERNGHATEEDPYGHGAYTQKGLVFAGLIADP